MLFTENNRSVIKCNRCPIRLDLGPARALEGRERMPSMWRSLGENNHLCPSCAVASGPRFQRTGGGVHLIRQ